MGKKKLPDGEEQDVAKKVTDIDALKDNVNTAVMDFTQRFISMPSFTLGCEVMDQGQLRDAMGLRATTEVGDPWPEAEHLLISMGFRWHMLGNKRVMYLQEKDNVIPEDGWCDGEAID